MKNILVIIFSFTALISAQQITNWQNYTNMQSINDCEANNDVMWAASDGGIFAYFHSDSSYLILTKSEGLSSQTITSISIDSAGNIWAGTSDGYINVYDPSTNEMRTLYDIAKTNESNKRINDIEISNDTAYVSTEFGLILFNTSDLSVFDSILKFGEFNTRTPVRNVLLGSTIYVVTQSGIAKSSEGSSNLQAPESWENFEIPSVNNIHKTAISDGILYAATDRGIFEFRDNVWTSSYLEGENVLDIAVKNNLIYCITGVYQNDKWIESALVKFSPNQDIIYTSSNSLYTKINFLSDESIILGTDKGLILITPTENLTINPNSPATNAIISLTVDSEGNLWSATGKDNKGIGVLKFDGDTWQIFNSLNTSVFKMNDFHHVSSSDHAVYLSTWGRGFVRFKDGLYESFDTENTSMIGIPNSNIFLAINDVQEDSEGNAWISNYWSADRKPISVLTQDGQIFNYQFSSPLSPQIVNVNNLVIDQFNTKWISGNLSGDVPTEGLYYFNENGTFENTSDDIWGRITVGNGLRNRDVKALAIDQFGELIIGTSIGVDVIQDPSNPNTIRGDQYFAIRQQTINCIAVDPINQKWIGTEKGIFLMNSDGSNLIANYTKANSPLPSDNIKTIAIDKEKGIVYVGTDFGVTAISTLFIEPNDNFSEMFVYPNPLILDSKSDNNVIISGLIEDSEIKILDISGNLVDEFRSIGGKTTTWDCRDLGGKLISSGIYIIVAFDEDVNEIGHAKLAVLRK